jgi:hypothetical protein
LPLSLFLILLFLRFLVCVFKIPMFVLNPSGSSSKKGSWRHSIVVQNLWFFGGLGIYFGIVRLAYVFLNKTTTPKAITEK